MSRQICATDRDVPLTRLKALLAIKVIFKTRLRLPLLKRALPASCTGSAKVEYE